MGPVSVAVIALKTVLGVFNTAFCLAFTLYMSFRAIFASMRDPSGKTTRKLGRYWGQTMCRRCAIDLTIEGGEAVDWNGPLVVMANHQSLFDIPVLYAALPIQAGMLAKKELFRIPFFGQAMTALGCLPIDRRNRRQSFASLRDAAERAQKGQPILVFPEGTRSPDGRIHTPKKGPFHLAELAAVPIIPVGIHGTRDVLDRSSILVQSRPVRVRIGAPLRFDSEVRGATAREDMRRRVKSALVELSGLPAASDDETTEVEEPNAQGD